MKIIHAAVFAALAAASTAALAAKPTTIVLDAEHQATDGATYSTYTVKCSDGSESTLTSWTESRKWCVGDTESEQCERKQIKAAQKACKV